MKPVHSRLWLAALCLTLITMNAHADSGVSDVARSIVEASDCPGGICVVLDSSVDLAIALAEQGQFTVQVLCESPDDLIAVRASLRAKDAYGTISADLAPEDGLLPYADNLINLLVVGTADVSLAEAFRVLTPLGTAWGTASGKTVSERLAEVGFTSIKAADEIPGWLQAIKPWPAEIDEWTHFLHGADGNPVANDTVVGPPEHYQWISEPLWLRSHESDSSIKTAVTAGGRLFYIVDEGPTSLLGPHTQLDKWSLAARDAFNGVLLWKVPIKDYGWRAWKPSWFSPRPGDIPLNVQKCLIAVDDKVYASLGYQAPISQLDAKTGEVLQVYEGTDKTGEFLYHEGTLIVSVVKDDQVRVMAVDTASGQTLWTSKNAYNGTTIDYYRFTAGGGNVEPAKVAPTLNTATDGDAVGLLDGSDIVCLDFNSGAERWRSRFPSAQADANAGKIDAGQNLWTGTLIVMDGAVVHASPNQLAAFKSNSGEILWTQAKKYIGHLWYSWKDVFVIDGLVWTWSAETEHGILEVNGKPSNQKNHWPLFAHGYDLHTGELAKQVDLGPIFKTHHHHRCYRNKATSRFILASRRGTEFVDLENGQHTVNNWVRGTCHLGMMPANGLQYAPPHPCACYSDEKLNGLTVLAPVSPPRKVQPARHEMGLLEKGPAFGGEVASASASEAWPTFRGDAARSGSVETTIPGKPKLLWARKAGTKLAPPIVAEGKVFVPLIEEHHLAAMDAVDGTKLWEFATGGRIDSPPTYHHGAVIFGSADGWVYSVRADNGQLIWRYRASAEDRRMGAFGQIESAWPVHGSVLVQEGIAYFVAGRSSHLDGGLIVCGLDATTGHLEHRRLLQGPAYDVNNITQNYQLPEGYLPDILLSENSTIYMGELALGVDLKIQPRTRGPLPDRVFAKGGMLDDTQFKRMPWSFGPKKTYARVVVHNAGTAYFARMFDSMQGLSPHVFFTPGEKGYQLFAVNKESQKQSWSLRIPVRTEAMVATDNLLIVGGSPDVIDPDDPLGVFEGRGGGLLSAHDSATGEQTWQAPLSAPPVFNGMAAADGRVYVTLQDGSVACFGR